MLFAAGNVGSGDGGEGTLVFDVITLTSYVATRLFSRYTPYGIEL